MASVTGVKFDKDFYFQDVKHGSIELQIVNVGKTLAFTDITLSPGKMDAQTKKVEFNHEQKVTNYDVFPSFVIVPPGQRKTIKLLRNKSHMDSLFSKTGHEEYYRIRAVPKSSSEALKSNPELWNKLNDEEKQQIEDMNNTVGKIQLSVGSGSVIIVQNGLLQDFTNLMISKHPEGKALKIKLSNKGLNTINLLYARLQVGNKWLPLLTGNIILKSNEQREFFYSEEQLKILGKFELKEAVIIFNSTDGKQHKRS